MFQESNEPRQTRNNGRRPSRRALYRNTTVVRHYDPTERGVWNIGGNRRPGFTEETCDAVLTNVAQKETSDGTSYQCEDCRGFFCRKSALNAKAQKSKGYITIDHIEPQAVYIRKNAESQADGQISRQAAKKAYNDLKNLRPLCNKCNSSKNGPKDT